MCLLKRTSMCLLKRTSTRDKLRPPPRLSGSSSKRSAPNGASSPRMTYPRSRTRMISLPSAPLSTLWKNPWRSATSTPSLMAVSSDPKASYSPPPKIVPPRSHSQPKVVSMSSSRRDAVAPFSLRMFRRRRDRHGPVTNSPLHGRRSRPGTSSSPEVSAAENQSREVEGQTCPSTATAKAPEVISKGGLTTDEARSRLARSGPNAMPDTSAHPIRRALEKFWAPVPWMLEAAIVVELALGKYVEAGIIALLLVFNAALGLFQESRAQAALTALKSRLALTASVQRDGAWKTVPATEVVPGDVVKLSLGAVVAADVKLTGGEVLLDQSMLTGESIPIEAGVGVQTYAGALVRRGEAEAEVTATGARTK